MCEIESMIQIEIHYLGEKEVLSKGIERYFREVPLHMKINVLKGKIRVGLIGSHYYHEELMRLVMVVMGITEHDVRLQYYCKGKPIKSMEKLLCYRGGKCEV